MNALLQRTALVMSLLVVACGSDKNSTPVYSTGVKADADASVATLSDNQRDQICASRESFFQTNLQADVLGQAICLAGALAVGGTPEQCQANLDICTSRRNQGLGVSVSLTGPTLTGQACADQLKQCNANVNQLEACVNVNTGIVYDILDVLSCRNAGQADTMERAKTLPGSGASSCTSLGSRCAGFGDPVLN